MIAERDIHVRFETRCGDVTAAAIMASLVAVVEGRLTDERVLGRVEDYKVDVSRVEMSEVPS